MILLHYNIELMYAYAYKYTYRRVYTRVCVCMYVQYMCVYMWTLDHKTSHKCWFVYIYDFIHNLKAE